MATASGKSDKSEAGSAARDLEADIAQLKEDIEKLAEQLRITGRHSYGAARRMATEGKERAWSEGEAAIENLRSTAGDLERQVVDTVRQKPMTALAIAAGIGFLVALLSRR
ncbi:MAG: DUF883 family protein [Rhizobiaceae bacterium]|nr:MAG: DUF883 family protein [Rhizobiaceae bacterium]CAG1013551.1 hypothetical protein RHIZO_04537 [Rhizobiaceae bacterium]